MKQIIAIDGPSGVGKSSVSKQLAKALGWTYLDTGATYRAVTLAWLRSDRKVERLADGAWLAGLDIDFREGAVYLNGEDVSQAIRTEEVTAQVSLVSAQPGVRTDLTRLQRKIGNLRPCILDGRDIGTVVFPDAFLKVFLTAGEAVRARRRWAQLGGERSGRNFEQVLEDQRVRDRKDASRSLAPLKKADDAWELDTDTYDQDQVAALIEREARRRLGEGSEPGNP